MAVTLISAAVVALLLREQPWDWRFWLAVSIAALICLGLYIRHETIGMLIFSAIVMTGTLSVLWKDLPSYRMFIWVLFGVFLWIIAMNILTTSPAITEAWPSALFCAILGTGFGWVILTGAFHFQLWFSVSLSLIVGSATFWLWHHQFE
jgi:hypothetical protein